MDIGKQKGYKRPMTLKKTIEQHKYTILFCLILVFGSILRLAQLGKVPGGYQMDEAYGAFNAYSLFTVGSIPQDTPILCISSPGEAGRMH